MGEAGAPEKRDQAIETLRIVAAFAIVAFHAQLLAYRWWHSGLVVFVFLAAMFAARPREEPRPVLPVLRRLMVPFAFWYAVYLAANAVMGRPLLLDSNVVTALLAGPSFHLWFLPFAALVLMALGQLPRLARSLCIVIAIASGWGALTAIVLGDEWFPLLWQLPTPLTQWGHALPAVLAGMFVGFHSQYRQTRPYAFVCCVLMALTAWESNFSSLGPAYIAGFAAITITAVLSRFWPANLRAQPIADCMFGVYLTHIITLAVAARLVGRDNWRQVILAFVLSLAGVYLARRFVPITRHVLG